MKTAPITVTSGGEGIREALALTEKCGRDSGLDQKSALHLRLLAEEVSGMLRGIAGNVEAEYWLEIENRTFELHLRSNVKMTMDMREQFLAASSGGKNYAASGFTGRIKVMIAGMLLSMEDALPYAMINTASAYTVGEGISWSMDRYRAEIQKLVEENKERPEAWDEIERSIIANIADDVKVSIVGKNVEIAVYKAF